MQVKRSKVDADVKRTKVQAANLATNDKVKAILSAEQYDKWYAAKQRAQSKKQQGKAK